MYTPKKRTESDRISVFRPVNSIALLLTIASHRLQKNTVAYSFGAAVKDDTCWKRMSKGNSKPAQIKRTTTDWPYLAVFFLLSCWEKKKKKHFKQIEAKRRQWSHTRTQNRRQKNKIEIRQLLVFTIIATFRFLTGCFLSSTCRCMHWPTSTISIFQFRRRQKKITWNTHESQHKSETVEDPNEFLAFFGFFSVFLIENWLIFFSSRFFLLFRVNTDNTLQ